MGCIRSYFSISKVIHYANKSGEKAGFVLVCTENVVLFFYVQSNAFEHEIFYMSRRYPKNLISELPMFNLHLLKLV